MEQLIREEYFGKDWPFTVSEGMLKIEGHQITFTHNKREYGINGFSLLKKLADPVEICKEQDTILYLEMRRRYPDETPKQHKSLSPIIRYAQEKLNA